MLYNEIEKNIMKNAVQPSMRWLNSSTSSFNNIWHDFFSALPSMANQNILDIGPGQCDMLDIFKEQGAKTYGVDFDPAVIELGSLRGHNMQHVRSIQAQWPYEVNMFDGIFCRGSLNYFRGVGSVPSREATFLETIFMSAKKDAWIWIAPWLKPSEGLPDLVVHAIRDSASTILEKHSIENTMHQDELRQRWGINWLVPYKELWIRNFAYNNVHNTNCIL